MLLKCPNTNQSMYSFIADSNKEDKKAVKVVYFNHKITFEKLYKDVDSVALYLTEHGVKKGDSVVLCLPNIPQAVIALYAINKVGAICNVVHPKIGTLALLKIIHETATNWVFCYSSAIMDHAKELRKAGVNIVHCRISQYMPFGLPKIVLSVTEIAARRFSTIDFSQMTVKNGDVEDQARGEDVAVYLHSSGTTGDPKTVMLSNYAMNELAGKGCNAVGSETGIGKGDTNLMLLPLFHGFGLGVCLHWPMFFGVNILLPSFDAIKAVAVLRKYKPNVLSCVPSMLRRMYKLSAFSGEHLKSIKSVYVGGDKLDDKLRQDVENCFRKNGSLGLVYEGFGLSEMASMSHLNILHFNDGTVGQPSPTVRQKIMRADGTECEPFEEGELYLSGTQMMTGYLNQTTPFVKDADGTVWFPTGDFGYLGEKDSLYYRGRLKRLIKIGGVNIFPQEVETVAANMKEIEQACAVRVKIDGKPAIKLLVVLKPGVRLTPMLKSKIKDAVRDNILPYAVPREIEAVSSIRLSGMGKCDYRSYEEQV